MALPSIPLRLVSEDIEPTMLKVLAVLIARVEKAKEGDDRDILVDACAHLWYGIEAINKLAIAVRGNFEGSDCLHFSIASNNYARMVRKYIEDLTSLDPETDAPFQWRTDRPRS